MARLPDSTDKEQHKRRTILEAARTLLVEHGFHDVALDDVAKRAGVAKGTLFLYYRSKEELVSAAFADLVDRLGEQLGAVQASGRKGRELLDASVQVIVEYFDENRDFMAQMGPGRLPGCSGRASSRLMDKFGVNHRRMRDILRACVEQGVLRECDLGVAASFLFGLCRSSMFYHSYMTRNHKSAAGRRGEIVDMFLRGLAR